MVVEFWSWIIPSQDHPDRSRSRYCRFNSFVSWIIMLINRHWSEEIGKDRKGRYIAPGAAAPPPPPTTTTTKTTTAAKIQRRLTVLARGPIARIPCHTCTGKRADRVCAVSLAVTVVYAVYTLVNWKQSGYKH